MLAPIRYEVAHSMKENIKALVFKYFLLLKLFGCIYFLESITAVARAIHSVVDGVLGSAASVCRLRSSMPALQPDNVSRMLIISSQAHLSLTQYGLRPAVKFSRHNPTVPLADPIIF